MSSRGGRAAFGVLFVMLLAVLCIGLSAPDQVRVLTQHNDSARTGANLKETRLKTSNVRVDRFGKLYSLPVDGNLYAQPLYVPHVSLPDRRTCGVIYVATEHNSVYAFDAEGRFPGPLWRVNLGPSAAMPNADFGNRASPFFNLFPEVGITGTPVIDRDSGTLYVVAFTKEGGTYHHRLHALDITTGGEQPRSPVEITGSVPGTASDSHPDARGRRVIDFVSRQHLQRPALLLSRGIVYIAFGSHTDTEPYHGWVFAYNAATLRQEGILNVTPKHLDPRDVGCGDSEGGIWQSGQGLAADDRGNVYFVTSNGTYDEDSGHFPPENLGNSFVKLAPASGGRLRVVDWFTPFDQRELNHTDCDLGSSGPLLLPGDRLLGGSKEGRLYLLDTNNRGPYGMGRYDPKRDHVVQEFQVTLFPKALSEPHHIHGAPIYWDGPGGRLVYVWGEDDHLKAFKMAGGSFPTRIDPRGVRVGATAVEDGIDVVEGMPGGMLSLSADRGRAGTGIVWATHPYARSALTCNVAGVLRAFDASDIRRELWDSKENAARDDVGLFAKFCPVTVAEGRVYVPTFSGYLHVYGLLSDYHAPLSSGRRTARPPSVSALPADRTTGGNWTGTYGRDGYYVVGDSALYPKYARANPVVPGVWVWYPGNANAEGVFRRDPHGSDRRALRREAGPGRVAACWHSNGEPGFLIDIDAAARTCRVTLYVLDWDGQKRSERLEVLDPATGRVLDTRIVSSFRNGQYLPWRITGHVQIRATRIAGPNAVISGLFFDP